VATKESRKLSAVVLEELQKRSNNGLEFAKKTMLAERIEYERLREALEHYVMNWNDFTHPGLFSLACEAVGGDPNNAVRVQAAIAMMAAAFDLHDDIIDESGQKHGVPTVFGKYGRNITLLLGNAFLIKGFTLFCISIEELGREILREVVEVLQRSLFELGNAHALELDLRERTNAEPREYMHEVEVKAASIEGDMRIGAIIGGGTHEEVEALARYGRILGTLAILREEFVDVFDVDELNQRVSNEYMPIPILYAMQDTKSKKKIEELLARKITSGDVDALVDTVFKTQKVKNLKGYMEYLVDKAIHIASNVQNKNLRDQLRTFASSSIEDL
jgi:geranylgeranyl diphosphate synthase type I